MELAQLILGDMKFIPIIELVEPSLPPPQVDEKFFGIP